MLPFPDPLAARELLHTSHIDRVDARAIIRQQRRERPPDHLRPIHDADRPAEESVPVR